MFSPLTEHWKHGYRFSGRERVSELTCAMLSLINQQFGVFGLPAQTQFNSEIILAIRRSAQHRDCTNIPNTIAQDQSLSWEARGLLVFILSKPEDFKVTPAYLVKQGIAGRDKINRLLAELKANGYLLNGHIRPDNNNTNS